MTLGSLKSVLDVKRKAWMDQLDALTEEFDATNNQLITAVDKSLVPTLKRKLASLEKEMDEIEGKLRRSGRVSVSDFAQASNLDWERELSEIDFVEAWSEFRMIFQNHVDRDDGGAVLLLLPDYETMCADLLVQRIRRWLNVAVEFGALRECHIQILDSHQLNSTTVLKKLGSYFFDSLPRSNREFGWQLEDIQVYTQQLVDKICAALDVGQLLYVELAIAPQLYTANAFLLWLLDDFWTSLTHKLSDEAETTGRSPLRCVFVVTTLEPLPTPRPLADRYCPAREFCADQRNKIVPLTLTNWAEPDIGTWLQKSFGWENNIVRDKAHFVFTRSLSGRPIYVQKVLREMLTQISMHP